jgi:integrase
MPKGVISKRSIDELSADESAKFLWDDALKGFGVKANPSGSKSFIFQFRVAGRAPVRMQIGDVGGFDQSGRPWTPDRARIEAQRLRGLVASGIDPMAQKRDAAEAGRKARVDEQRIQQLRSDNLVSALVSAFLDKVKAETPRSYRFYEPTLRLHVLPLIGHLAMPDLTKADANRIIDAIPVEKRALRRAVFASARALWNWSATRIDLPHRSPFEMIAAPRPADSRDRVLDDDELKTVWQAAAQLERPWRQFVHLLLLTGQRRDEVARMDWSEVDRGAKLWSLPRSRTKNGLAHTLPLAPAAIDIFDTLALGEDWPKTGPVVTTNFETPISAFGQTKRVLDAKIAETTEIRPWRLHDLRRTVATGLQRLGVRFEVTEAVLNHRSGSQSGVAGVYQRHSWAEEKRAALESWARHVGAIVEGADQSNVVPMRRGEGQ